MSRNRFAHEGNETFDDFHKTMDEVAHNIYSTRKTPTFIRGVCHSIEIIVSIRSSSALITY